MITRRNNITLGILLSISITMMMMLTKFVWGDNTIDYYRSATLLIRLLLIWFMLLGFFSIKRYEKLIPNVWIRGLINIHVVTFVIALIMRSINEMGAHLNIGHLELSRRPFFWDIIEVMGWSYTYHWVLYTQQSIEEKKRAELEIERAQQRALEARLSSFREQLSPHFMFNSLNTLSAMTQDEAVQQFVNKLASVYRYLLTQKEQPTVTLHEELDFTEEYWYILKERFEEAIELRVEVSPEAHRTMIPPLTLQTLVENAIKHNKGTWIEPLVVSIRQEGDTIVVTNKIQPKLRPAESTKLGLKILTERYQLLFNKEVEIIKNDHFTVKLPLIKP